MALLDSQIRDHYGLPEDPELIREAGAKAAPGKAASGAKDAEDGKAAAAAKDDGTKAAESKPAKK